VASTQRGILAHTLPGVRVTSADAAVSAPARCAWCGSELGAVSHGSPGVAWCDRCGAATTQPWPSEAELEQAYSDWYRPESGRFAGPGDALLRVSRGRLARRLDRIAPPGRVLDVGAGEGALLDALDRSGRAALGLERRSSRPDVVAAEIGELEGPFAAIVFWHSLEHLRRPREALERAAALLAPGGVLAVAVPNAGSLQARAFGERWFALDLPRHLVHIPARTLERTLAELGLEVERRSHLCGGQVLFGWLHGLVGALPGHVDLYDAIRRPAARRRPLSPARRAGAIVAATALLPVAAAGAALEAALRRGGSVYLEARRA
jgi:SAM-dependent methyltransferase